MDGLQGQETQLIPLARGSRHSRSITMTKALLALVFSFALSGAIAAQIKGPIVDKILFNARSQEDLGLMDVATGKSDVWNYGTGGNVFNRLPPDIQSKLEVYSVSGASYLGLLINPYPDKAPYISDAGIDASGVAQFNPLAMRKVRYALNWLVNRQRIVDEVFGGAGVPMFTPVVPGLPNASHFSLVAAKQGMTAGGNEASALADIDAAMREAAALPELAGRLSKGLHWWSFDGAPVTIRFVIRADDPNSRLPVGRYISDQIEKAGIKVERLEYDRTKASGLVNRTDPASNQWSVYTEGLGSNETNAYWEMTIAYDYAPWASVMPGGRKKDYWSYENVELDRLTQSIVDGRISSAADYWDKLLAATGLGVKESVRVMLAAKTSYLAAAKDRFAARMAWGLGDGIDKWSTYTADVKPESSGPDAGKKLLRLTGFSSRGALFMNAWDPIGPDGFGDTYSGAIIKQLSDLELEPNPATGIPMPVRATWAALNSGGDVLPVPAQAVLWNAESQRWESGFSYAKGAGGAYSYQKVARATARSQATFAFRFGAWHHGRPVDQNDYRYALAFPYEIALDRGSAGGAYDASYASGVNPRLARAKGYIFNKDGSIGVWSDAAYPMDQAQLAGMMVPSLQVAAINSGAVLPWEILEALKSIVSESSASGTAYSYNSDSRFTEVDLLSPRLVGDLKAKLNEFIGARRVPASLAGFMSPERAVEDYQLTLRWLERRGNAYISNGGFFLERYDPVGNTGILSAFRDPSYPFAQGYWASALKTVYSRVDSVKPGDYKKGQDLKVTVTVSQLSYPQNQASAASQASVRVSLMLGDREITAAAKYLERGIWEALLPHQALDALKAGAYTVVAESSLGKGDSPGVGSSVFLKF
jgi:peptide/nickel transport system substrate-binding protein